MSEPLLMNSKEAAALLKIGINKLRELARDGKIPVVKLHQRDLRFYRPALEEWLRHQSQLAG